MQSLGLIEAKAKGINVDDTQTPQCSTRDARNMRAWNLPKGPAQRLQNETQKMMSLQSFHCRCIPTTAFEFGQKPAISKPTSAGNSFWG